MITGQHKNDPEVGKVVLPIQEILQNYYSMESREGTKTLKTSLRMPYDISFQLRFFFSCFCFVLFCFFSAWNFKANRQTVILVSYGFFVLQHG